MTHNAQNQKDIYLGLDIGGTKCSVVVGDASFSVMQKIVFDTLAERGYKAILSEFRKNIKSLLTEFSAFNLKRIGISCGGPLDSKKGMIYSPRICPDGIMYLLPEYSVMNSGLKQHCRTMQMPVLWQNG